MRVVLLLLVSFLTSNSFASEIFFLNKSTTDAVALAAKLDKPFFVFYCGRWCPTCKVMEDHTFQDDKVAAFASENFLAFKANIDEPNGKQWKEQYGVYVVPTIIFFDKYGKQQDLHASTMTAIAFLDVMKKNAAMSTSPLSEKPFANYTNPIANTISESIVSTNSRPTVTGTVQPNMQTVERTVSEFTEQKTAKSLNVQSGFSDQNADLANTNNIDNSVKEEVTLQETIASINKIALSNDKEITALPQKKKSKKGKRNKRKDAKTDLAFPIVTPNSNQEIAALHSLENKADEIVAPVIPEATKPIVTEKKPVALPSTESVRPKRKSIVLNPKKETVPRQIVIRAERPAPIPTTTSAPAPTQMRVVSMVTNQTVTQPVIASNPEFITSYLQLGHFESRTNASALVKKVRMKFYNNFINLNELSVDGKQVYRVTITGFQSRQEMNQIKSQLKAEGFKSFIFEN